MGYFVKFSAIPHEARTPRVLRADYMLALIPMSLLCTGRLVLKV